MVAGLGEGPNFEHLAQLTKLIVLPVNVRLFDEPDKISRCLGTMIPTQRYCQPTHFSLLDQSRWISFHGISLCNTRAYFTTSSKT
jgi:hypothetical protein